MYKSSIVADVIASNIDWFSDSCNSYVVRNQGNVIVTLMNYITLAPGESFRSDEARPDVVCDHNLKIEFDGSSTIVDNSIYPGIKQIRDNAVLKTDRDARVLIVKTFLTKI